jgi:hypothetical protein
MIEKRVEKVSEYFQSKTVRFVTIGLILAAIYYVYTPVSRVGFVAEDFIFLEIISQSINKVIEIAVEAQRVRLIILPFDWIQYQFFGSQPEGYHRVSLALHLLNIILVYFFISRFSENRAAGVIAALFWGVNPRHHQAVIWFSAQHYLLTTFFGLLSLYTHLLFLESSKRRWRLFSFLFLALAVFTHDFAIVLPVLLPLTEALYPGIRKFKSLLNWNSVRRYLPEVLLILLFATITFFGNRAEKLTSVVNASTYVSEGYQIEGYRLVDLSQWARNTGAYITYGLNPYIPLRSLDPGWLAYALTFGSIIIFCLLLIFGQARVKFFTFWAGLSLLPFILFVPFGNADRYFYFASIGFAAAAGILLAIILRSIVLKSLPALLIALFMVGNVVISLWLINVSMGDWISSTGAVDRLVTRVVDDYPDPEHGSQFYFVGIPVQMRYAYFGNFFEEALAWYYRDNANICAYSSRDEDLIALLGNQDIVDAGSSNLHVYLYQSGSLQERVMPAEADAFHELALWSKSIQNENTNALPGVDCP